MKNNNSKGFAPIILVIVIVAVLAVGGGAYYLSKTSSSSLEDNYQPIDNSEDITPTQNSSVNNTELKNSPQIYKNTELGFSFLSPYGPVKSYDGRDFIGKGEKGEDLRGYISTNFYFAGMTPDYSAPRDVDCGEVKSLAGYQFEVSRYGEIINSNGVRYVYGNVTTNDLEGPHQIALFKLNKGQFPVLGFCAKGMREVDFKNLINTVIINK